MRTFLSFYALCVFLLLSTVVSSQTPAPTIRKGPALEDLVIKDSSGNTYTTNQAKIFLMTGEYTLRSKPGSNEAILGRLSDAEKAMRESMLGSASMKPKESNFFKVGNPFPPFKDKDIKGNKYNLKEMEGKVVVLNFWFINCPPCRKEIPELNQLVEKYKDNKDVVFLAIALDEQWELEDFLKTSPFNYNIISNGRYNAQKYGINLFPTHVVIDKKRNVLFHTSGLAGGTVPWLKKAIEAGLTGAELK